MLEPFHANLADEIIGEALSGALEVALSVVGAPRVAQLVAYGEMFPSESGLEVG
jgi:hypothetical protein